MMAINSCGVDKILIICYILYDATSLSTTALIHLRGGEQYVERFNVARRWCGFNCNRNRNRKLHLRTLLQEVADLSISSTL